ncbi:hypothetical protein AMECASPLE_024386, partial [Ameca splendens]
KHASESAPGFEQRLQVMLHTMEVAKTPPADTRMCQYKDEELRKAVSEAPCDNLCILVSVNVKAGGVKDRLSNSDTENQSQE